jgi:hypothetical protein
MLLFAGNYGKMIQYMCSRKGIFMLKALDMAQLGEYAGLTKQAQEGEPIITKPTGSVGIKSFGEEVLPNSIFISSRKVVRRPHGMARRSLLIVLPPHNPAPDFHTSHPCVHRLFRRAVRRASVPHQARPATGPGVPVSAGTKIRRRHRPRRSAPQGGRPIDTAPPSTAGVRLDGLSPAHTQLQRCLAHTAPQNTPLTTTHRTSMDHTLHPPPPHSSTSRPSRGRRARVTTTPTKPRVRPPRFTGTVPRAMRPAGGCGRGQDMRWAVAAGGPTGV